MSKKTNDWWKQAVLSAGVCAGIGLVLLFLNLGHDLKMLGYDLLFRVPKPVRAVPNDVVIVYMDDDSFQAYHQKTGQAWDLNLHAALVDRFTRDGARVVVFDVIFNVDSSLSAKSNFTRAMRQNGRVVLAAGMESQQRAGFRGEATIRPTAELEEAAAMVGVAGVTGTDKNDVVRDYYLGKPSAPSLPWAAARVAQFPITTIVGAHEPETWLNYYGPALRLPHLSYPDVSVQPAGFFRGKCVFIGANPSTLLAEQQADTFRTPYSIFLGSHRFPGVELAATRFLNIIQADGLRHIPERIQAVILLLAGILTGGLLSLLRPWPATAVAAGEFVMMILAAGIAFGQHWWFGWTIVAFVQIPLALGWSIRRVFFQLRFDKEVAERALSETTRIVEATRATAAQKPAFVIPDHALVRLVGRGGYGEVWLARNAIGAYHVVKLIKRRGFPSDEPYEREFRGIQKFMPVSRSHPGFVHILHVGRNDEEQFYFCIMEAGDDRRAGHQIDPDTYEPRTLWSEMEERGRISPEEGLELGLAMSAALEHLHQEQLVHRDIKPPNIIYVRGAPKFADIGLVTDIAGARGPVSQVGTEGYLAPEGTGTPAADVYALGKVLYESVMGRDRRLFPEVATAVFEEPAESLLRGLYAVILRACASDPARRYGTAGQMHEDLKRLASPR